MVSDRNKRILYWAITILVVGPLGNAAWEWLVKPSLVFITSALLDIASLAFWSLKDSIYRTVGQMSDRQIPFLTMILLCLLTMIFVIRELRIFPFEGDASSSREVDAKRGHRRQRFLFELCCIWVLVFVAVLVAKAQYIMSASDNLASLQAMAAPYMQEHDRLMTASKIAQIRNREDYVDINEQLTKVLQQNGITPPDFDAW